MLNRIPFRIIWRNKSQFLGIVLLVFLSSLAYTVFSSLIKDIEHNYKNFADGYNQESFHFITLLPIDQREISQKYDLDIEERFSWDYEFKGKTLRLFNVSKNINKPLVTEGKLPGPQEIAIDVNFAQANGLKVGDDFEIEGRKFRISGYSYFPDYIYIIKSERDILPDPSHFGVGLMDLSVFKPFLSHAPFHYYMVRGEGENWDRLKEELNSKYKLLNFQEKWDNLRIITTEKKMEGAKPTSLVLSGTILIISSILLFIVLRRLINSMHAEIGTLYALGYNRREISGVYMLFPVLIWLLGSVPGTALGYYLSEPYLRFYASYFAIPLTERIFSYQDLIAAVFLPAAFMISAGYLALSSLLKRSVVEIIRGESEKAFGKKYRMSFLDRFSFRRRLTLKQGLLHPSREAVLVIGIVFSTFLLLYAVTARSAFSVVIDKTYKDVFRYNYMYLFNAYQTDNKFGDAERFNVMAFTLKGTKAKVEIYGLERDSEMVLLEDEKGNRLKLKGLVISKSLADKFGLKVGDTLSLDSRTTGRKYSLKIMDIAHLFVGNSGYMKLDEFNTTFDLEKGSFLGLFSRDKLNIPEEQILTVLDKNYLIRVFKENSAAINQMLQALGFVSFLLALTIVYVLSSLTIAENRKPLALFKILGYRDGELSSIFLGFNNISFVIGFLLGIPVFSYFVNFIFNEMLKDVDFSLEMKAGFQDIVAAFVLLFLVFIFSKYLGRRRIYSISPGVILKEQME